MPKIYIIVFVLSNNVFLMNIFKFYFLENY